ncbi:MAG: hypothetical protein Pg6C_07240 [Treponemataceae bacterium]|nr:MAG: hypothetical protein Pg6C_07240 [Treponemataceae bacterium]
MKKRFVLGMLAAALMFGFLMVGCASIETRQYGEAGDDTIALNLTSDSGDIFVTHVNGVPTGAKPAQVFFLFFGSKGVYVNPVYVKRTGNTILFTITCPVASRGKVSYKSCELTLSKLSDLRRGEVLTLKYMYLTQTFAFIDATGNIIQQTIPTFK